MSAPVLDRHDTRLPEYPAERYDDAAPQSLRAVSEVADRIFRGITRFGGLIVLAIMGLVGIFLTVNAVQAVSTVGLWEFLTETNWSPETDSFGIASLLVFTVLIAAVALVIAFPLSIGLALFVTEIATGALQRTLRSLVDLMAAVPSVVFGLWGLALFQQEVIPFVRWLSTWLGWIPIFHVSGVEADNPLPDDSLFKASTFIAGVVVSLMVIPIMTNLMIESFSRAPVGEREGAYALGATRWGMIKAVVLPFGKGGIIGGTMLGLGRALGETIAIYLIVSPLFDISFEILHRGSNSIAAHIALRYGEANAYAMSALMAAGLTLFILTMIINFTASTIIARSRSGAESEA